MSLLARRERYNDAVRLLKRVLTLKTNLYGERSMEVAKSHELFGNIRLAQGEIDVALKHLRKAEALYKDLKGIARS